MSMIVLVQILMGMIFTFVAIFFFHFSVKINVKKILCIHLKYLLFFHLLNWTHSKSNRVH